ncbi:alpha-L-rhamnosidase C-terminal domain-containing protein [Arthrobacter sp. H-02-3]|uniref:alpha-L-rhamnosidase C-terminal domain-containing protein n=1 Tax=Arthrobacter sp. H-02-3 TaxID=2703675 RepID=UPI003FA43B2D
MRISWVSCSTNTHRSAAWRWHHGAQADRITPYGLAIVRWQLDGEDLTVHADVPDGSTPALRLPGMPDATTGPGNHKLASALVG